MNALLGCILFSQVSVAVSGYIAIFKQASIILVGLFVFFSEGAYNHFWEGGTWKSVKQLIFFHDLYFFLFSGYLNVITFWTQTQLFRPFPTAENPHSSKSSRFSPPWPKCSLCRNQTTKPAAAKAHIFHSKRDTNYINRRETTRGRGRGERERGVGPGE